MSSSSSAPAVVSPLHGLPYAQDAGNAQWNLPAPDLAWSTHRADDDEVDLPYLADCVLYAGDAVIYAHVTTIAAGPRGSVFLGNVISMNRHKLTTDQLNDEVSNMVALDLSTLLPNTDDLRGFSAVLDYMYTGKVNCPLDLLPTVLVTSFVLRIPALFETVRSSLESMLQGGNSPASSSTVANILANVRSLSVSEDTAAVVDAVRDAAQAVLAGDGGGAGSSEGTAASSPTPRAPKKYMRRRSSYRAAMKAVHKKHVAVKARVKAGVKPAASAGKSTEAATVAPPVVVQKGIAKYVVQAGQRPGQRVEKVKNNRRMSFTIPQGAKPGDILNILVEGIGSSPPPPPPPPPSQDLPDQASPPMADIARAAVWVYKDADGKQFGPFDRSLMHGWESSKMIPRSLLVRPAEMKDVDFLTIDTIWPGGQEAFA